MAWNGYRAAKVAGGGAYNGYAAPNAKQDWAAGQIVNVGFVKGLVVKGRASTGAYELWQPATGRYYQFTPHMGLYRI